MIQVKRLEFAKRCIENKDTFEDVIFNDESLIQLTKHSKLSFRKRGEQVKLQPKPKHPYKVYVWAGISKRGPTNISIFKGIMDAQFFTYTILGEYLLPFIE